MRKDTAVVLAGAAVAAVTAASIVFLGNGDLPWAPARQETVSGLASCRSGRAVVGIWIAEDTNVGLFANRSPEPKDPSTTVYNATIPVGVGYQLHVGCGGSPQNWAMSASTGNTTTARLAVRCDDVKSDPEYGTCS
jgi:hypothetical protein